MRHQSAFARYSTEEFLNMLFEFVYDYDVLLKNTMMGKMNFLRVKGDDSRMARPLLWIYLENLKEKTIHGQPNGIAREIQNFNEKIQTFMLNKLMHQQLLVLADSEDSDGAAYRMKAATKKLNRIYQNLNDHYRIVSKQLEEDASYCKTISAIQEQLLYDVLGQESSQYMDLVQAEYMLLMASKVPFVNSLTTWACNATILSQEIQDSNKMRNSWALTSNVSSYAKKLGKTPPEFSYGESTWIVYALTALHSHYKYVFKFSDSDLRLKHLLTTRELYVVKNDGWGVTQEHLSLLVEIIRSLYRKV